MGILEAIKRTIKYHEKFGGILSENDLYERLIDEKVYLRCQMSDVRCQVLKKENKYLKKKVGKAEELARLIEKRFKDILFLGITGSVAAGNPKKESDIDLMVITKADKLWINRLKMRLFVSKNKVPHRRYGEKEKTDEFCFNLWLDEKSLGLKKDKQNLKNAMDLILIKPLINRDKTYEKFIASNGWAKRWVGTGYQNKIFNLKFEIFNKKDNCLDVIINWLVFWPQFWYMKRKIKNEKVGLHEAFFHH